MRPLPRKLALLELPSDDAEPSRIFDREIEEVITKMRRSISVEASADFHLNVFLAVTLRDKGPAALIAALKEAQQQVLHHA
jgi:hypothetical protein